MGGFLTILIILAIVVGVIFVQVQARQQTSLHTPLEPGQAAEVIRRYFRIAWSPESGPGDFNFTTRLRKYPPIISIKCDAAPEGGSNVDIWVSGSHTILGAMAHAQLLWRKKRGLANRLINSASGEQ